MERLNCSSRSDALRALVLATASTEVVDRVQQAAFVRRPDLPLPRARRYRAVCGFQGLVGVIEVTLQRSQILTTDGHSYEFLAQLHKRGALLQPLPD